MKERPAQKAYRDRMRAAGRCARCGATSGVQYLCDVHRAEMRGYLRRYLAEKGSLRQLAARGTREWAEWVEGLAAMQQTTVSELIDLGLREIAEQCGYPDAPPRTPAQREV